ncbi:hypothetical protein EST38_g6772 [Candolleomyces aberdarensis]|uniref:Geranylgeranyl pyrophosphate synthetase n=1 Tax=Candolleomyces aberdarensis TaxID=2316362 RepID=A0A4Q2DJR0_9AGAR|nr:hypothetical protein EST38_g6772 [Candolleomyces aberdarensis]
MATDTSKAPWRKSTFDPQRPLRGQRAGWSNSRNARGHGSPAYTPRNQPAVEALPPDRDLFENLHPTPLKTLAKVSASRGDEDVRVTDYEYIGSYSWTGCEAPTVIVPGAPRHWLNRNAPYNVQPDFGLFFIDHNGYKMPKAPLVPLVAAVTKRVETNPEVEFDWPSIDFVADRNFLRKLLRWVRNEDPAKDFRFDLELAGEKTVLVNRYEARHREQYNGRTYGYNFEKSSTEAAPGCQKATGHHRIAKYDLNGLKMVVRFEVDACLPPTRSRKSIDIEMSKAAVEEVAGLLAAVDLSSGTSSTSQSPFNLNIIQGGYEAKPPTIMELTTRFEGRLKDFDWEDKYNQIFFSQTPHHVLAVHNRGRFSEIQRRKLSDPQFQDIDKKMQPGFKALRKALGTIQQLVIENGHRGRLTLVCKDKELKVYERTNQDSCLPDHMIALFD